MYKVKLNISGMTCVNCSNAVERSALKVQGVKSAKVNFINGSGEFEIEKLELQETIKSRIQKLGYDVSFDNLEFEKQQNLHIKYLRNNFIVALILSVVVMCIEMLFMHNFTANLIIFALSSFVIFYNGRMFFTHAIASIKNKNYDMSVLVSLGASSAFLHSVFILFFAKNLDKGLSHIYVGGATMIISFVLLGKFLEERSKAKAGDYLKKLMDLSPKVALLVKGHDISEILVSSLNIGDIVAVKNGFAVPCDGVVVSGSAEIDASCLTGESLSEYKQVGDRVFAGTINTNGYILVKTEKLSSKSLMAEILNLLSQASVKKLPISQLADKVSNIFVPIVILISIATFFVWFLIKKEFDFAIVLAICTLIISCPCALGLATPIAVISGLSRAMSLGILVKNPEILQNAKSIKFAVFDKTGTLTEEKISVKNCTLSDENLAIALSVESLSEHIISKAIVEYAKSKGINSVNLEGKFENKVGHGIVFTNENLQILIGNSRLLETFNIDLNTENKNAIYFAINGKFMGYFELENSIRDGAKELISKLKKQNIEPIIISGDNEISVKKVAQELGIDKFYANTLPNQKLEILQELEKQGRTMFIGDGINDALTLKHSTIGIAMNSGSDIAKSAGDIVLIKNNLKQIDLTLNLAKKTMKTIKQNLFWAFIYNAVCIPVAAGVLYPVFGIILSPMYAALAMCFSSINVVLNSIRLRFAKF